MTDARARPATLAAEATPAPGASGFAGGDRRNAVPAATWPARVLAWRDRLLASPRFQEWAASTPLLRTVARRRARALFDLCAGFVYTQVLTAAVRVGLFDAVAAAPLTVAEIAARTQLPVEGAARLARAAAALDLLEARGGDRFGLGRLGAALRGNPGVTAMIAHHTVLYRDLADPVALLRGESAPDLAAYWPYAAAAPEEAAALGDGDVAAYSRLMAASQPFIAAEALAAYPFRRHRRILDIGGGEGAFALALADHAPAADITVFDLPAVAERARARFAQSPHRERLHAVGGDVRTASPPAGADLITLVRVLHDHDDATALTFARAARAAVAPGGRVVVIEPMADAGGARPVGDAYFGFYLLAMGSGRARRPSEIMALLQQAGFRAPRRRAARMPVIASVVEARA